MVVWVVDIQDILVYGSAKSKGNYTKQTILPLVSMSITDVEDSAEGELPLWSQPVRPFS